MTTIEVVEKELGNTLEIEEKLHTWRMPAAFGKDYTAIGKYLRDLKLEPVGMPYAHYLDVDWDAEIKNGAFRKFMKNVFRTWHFQAGLQAPQPVEGVGDIHDREYRKTRYVQAIHHGPYSETSQTFEQMMAWVKAEGLKVESEAFELYTNDPSNTPEDELETILLIPIRTLY